MEIATTFPTSSISKKKRVRDSFQKKKSQKLWSEFITDNIRFFMINSQDIFTDREKAQYKINLAF